MENFVIMEILSNSKFSGTFLELSDNVGNNFDTHLLQQPY